MFIGALAGSWDALIDDIDEFRKRFAEGVLSMAKSGKGGWVEIAARLGADLPEGKGRRTTLVARCAEEQLNEPLVSRFITARRYAMQWIGESEIKASHRSVEMLRTVENVAPSDAARVRVDVLTGALTRQQLDVILRDAQLRKQAQQVVKTSMSLRRIINRCHKDLSFMREFLWVEPPTGQENTLLGAAAEYSHAKFSDDEEGNVISAYEPRWALVVSPHISCSCIFGSGMKGFLLSVMSLSWHYANVSAFCSSRLEEKELLDLIIRFGGAELRKKVCTHVA